MGRDIRLDGRVALVTGGGRGLGRAHCLQLAARGAKVLVNDLGCGLFGEDEAAPVAHEVVQEIRDAGGVAAANTLSIVEPDNAKRIVQDALDRFGRLDIVVNNAGLFRRRPFIEHTPEMVDSLLEVHLKGAYYVSQAAYPVMEAQRYGRFIFTTSAGGIRGNPLGSLYCMAKAGAIGLMHAVSLAGEPHNILVNAISPYARTRMGKALEQEGQDRHMTEYEEVLDKVMDPRHAAAAVAYLASEECGLNHSILTVGGGRVALSAIVLGQGWQMPFGELLTPEAVRDHLPEILDLSGGTNPRSTDEEVRSFLGPAIDAATRSA